MQSKVVTLNDLVKHGFSRARWVMRTLLNYRIDSTERSSFLPNPLFPVTRSLTLSPHCIVDPLSPRLLDVHRAIVLIIILSGAGEYIERVLRDIEELDIREDRSTPLGCLAGL